MFGSIDTAITDSFVELFSEGVWQFSKLELRKTDLNNSFSSAVSIGAFITALWLSSVHEGGNSQRIICMRLVSLQLNPIFYC